MRGMGKGREREREKEVVHVSNEDGAHYRVKQLQNMSPLPRGIKGDMQEPKRVGTLKKSKQRTKMKGHTAH
mgnify:CR=1 FL=1